jgi:formate dehydrogenase assembly factor FdhD
MKGSVKRFQVEKAGDRAVVPTPENLKESAVGFMLSEGWLRENKPCERIEVDPGEKVCVRVDYRNALTE